MKILITGYDGMLGTGLVRQLTGKHELFGLSDRGESRSGVISSQIDITNRADVFIKIEDIRPDIVIHTAAYTDVDGCETNREKAFAINFEGAKNVVDACLAINAYFILISTDYVFDGKKKTQYNEGDIPTPLSVYGQSKLEAENDVKSKAKRYTIVRTSWLYGKNGKNFVDTILKLSDLKSELAVVADQVGRPTYTVDLAEGIENLLAYCKRADEYRIHGIVHIANDGETSWCDFAKEILKIKARNVKVSAMTTEQLARPAMRPAYSVLSLEKYQSLTGKPLRPWQEALREYLQ
ncbi:MAG: dTDP-4-dehydrorhamnose reductase [Omnitrophica bacterium RIFCSPLOWO2_12_FULL_44_17]|uniref:dTDP-4-dehydrorhamnose reductase n=1 Tax=Candidatus Danuiimicrobium aquiferis TaxID=1801832 RepID=A0A1G1KU13_9BACT|nr:MAG: dTDP-4-dehydrorhamnose reductase [Omnitrophica bacterium RIFCSPHIGHO2_02_FULL_45_28]OGW90195.1 MAG: dTDP-4-dehydrorhamnose reductase [Omnitrophica bacterium RIFCSPHIGHO2_12_FULL_44_12]OGW96396.1 MAG: dTDP-4-dehydrorhamnose reductase [Omnitrophica bacterium RIFCSPLOWO2_12_FULL_44_17]OGX04864.1 MAG: dTDP-4-dehydrorhamnose reductase [Omnitrophica bacterium RIFCSPLOWO2_02_FULL_44_11]